MKGTTFLPCISSYKSLFCILWYWKFTHSHCQLKKSSHEGIGHQRIGLEWGKKLEESGKMVDHLPRGKKIKKQTNSWPEKRGKSEDGKQMRHTDLLRQQLLLRCPWARCSTADCSDGAADWHQAVVVLGASQVLTSEWVWRPLLNESTQHAELFWVNKDKNKLPGWSAKC